jgi:hypothetical protein
MKAAERLAEFWQKKGRLWFRFYTDNSEVA